MKNRQPYFVRASRTIQAKVSNMAPTAFNPDVVLVIKYDSQTGMTKIESGNGQPINTLTAAILCINVAKGNMEAFAQQNILQPHKFMALAGETKCRVPRCGMPADHDVHNVSEEKPAVQ